MVITEEEKENAKTALVEIRSNGQIDESKYNKLLSEINSDSTSIVENAYNTIMKLYEKESYTTTDINPTAKKVIIAIILILCALGATALVSYVIYKDRKENKKSSSENYNY